MIRTAVFVVIIVWLVRLFVRTFYWVGFAIGWTLTRVVLIACEMLRRAFHAATVRDEMEAPSDDSETPSNQSPGLLNECVNDSMIVLDRRVMPYEVWRNRRRVEGRPSRKGR